MNKVRTVRICNWLPFFLLFTVTALFPGCGSNTGVNDDKDRGHDGGRDNVSDGSIGQDAASDSDIDADGDSDADSDGDSDAGVLSSWVVRIGGPEAEMSKAVAVLVDGSSIVAGDFGNSTKFGEGGENETVINAKGSGDAFFAKYDPEGVLLWVKTATSSQKVIAVDISALDNGSFISTGTFNGAATFGQGEPKQTSFWGQSDFEIFIAAYESDGKLAWAKKASGNTDVGSTAVDVLPDGSSLMAGFYEDMMWLEDFELVADGNQNSFISLFNSNGILEWVKNIAGYHVNITDIKALDDGSLIIVGSYIMRITFDAGEAGEVEFRANEDFLEEIFIAGYNPDGEFLWARTAGGPDTNTAHNIAVCNDDSFLLTGQIVLETKFNIDESDETELVPVNGIEMFVAKYNKEGRLIWIFQDGEEGFLSDSVIDVYQDGSFIVTGDFSESVTLGKGETNETTLASAGMEDIFAAHYSEDRSLSWAIRAGGANLMDWGLDVVAVDDGAAIVTGTFTDVATFFPDEPHEASLNSAGNRDIFLMRIGH